MKQKFLIFGALLLIVVGMIVLNAVSYVQKPTLPDTEEGANRSSYNAGATGTKALFQLLSETGSNVTRWQEDPSGLGTFNPEKGPRVFVLAGPFRRPVSEEDGVALLDWVASGGKLVLIDREPALPLAVTTADWVVKVDRRNRYQEIGVDPADVRAMTNGQPAIRPNAVTSANLGVNAVQPSRFASQIILTRRNTPSLPVVSSADEEEENFDIYDGNFNRAQKPPAGAASPEKNIEIYDGNFNGSEEKTVVNKAAETDSAPSPPPPPPPASVEEPLSAAWMNGPIVHLSDAEITLAAEVPYGSGRIFLISDPYIVSNGGLGNADNVQFILNALGSEGTIAFDEYHHGFGSGQNKLVEYFSGTPVFAILLQLGVLVAFIFYSRSRRFARPVPEPEPDRLSKLEYVSAMAELQRRTRAYDLALENIYGDLKRRAARLFGIDARTTPRPELAKLIGERIGRDPMEIDRLMAECEAAINGEKITEKRSIKLASEIRQIESGLRLTRQSGGSRR